MIRPPLLSNQKAAGKYKRKFVAKAAKPSLFVDKRSAESQTDSDGELPIKVSVV